MIGVVVEVGDGAVGEIADDLPHETAASATATSAMRRMRR